MSNKSTSKKNQSNTSEQKQSTKPENWLDDVDLESISPNELVALIENETEYDLVFSRLNELFLEYGNAMSDIDARRQHDIDLMKAVHSVWKSKPSSIPHIEYHEDDSDDNNSYNSEEIEQDEEPDEELDEVKEVKEKKVGKKVAVKKAAVKTTKTTKTVKTTNTTNTTKNTQPVSENEDKYEDEDEVIQETKPTKKVTTKKTVTKKAAPTKTVPTKTVPTKTVKKAKKD